MRRRIVLGAGIVTLILMVGVGFWLMEGGLPSQTAPLATLSSAELRMTLAWNGETVEAAAPVTLPRSILESREYRRWQRVGNITELVGTDPRGNRVVASALGFWMDSKGVRRPMIPSIKVFSPDGIVLSETSYSSAGLPEMWTLRDAKGRKTQEVWYRTSGLPGTPFLRQITFFNPDGTGRQFVSNNPERVAWAEWEVDSGGVPGRVLNGGRPELAKAFVEKRKLEHQDAVDAAARRD